MLCLPPEALLSYYLTTLQGRGGGGRKQTTNKPNPKQLSHASCVLKVFLEPLCNCSPSLGRIKVSLHHLKPCLETQPMSSASWQSFKSEVINMKVLSPPPSNLNINLNFALSRLEPLFEKGRLVNVLNKNQSVHTGISLLESCPSPAVIVFGPARNSSRPLQSPLQGRRGVDHQEMVWWEQGLQ